jgi:hypothetical protein
MFYVRLREHQENTLGEPLAFSLKILEYPYGAFQIKVKFEEKNSLLLNMNSHF